MHKECFVAALVFAIHLTLILDTLAQSCNVNDDERIDCGFHGINNGTCAARKCCWKASSKAGYPWCFYDTDTAAHLKTVSACQHNSPVKLQCIPSEKISIHDVFYGRNGDDRSCHMDGSRTCFNPNATKIVENICKTNSTCFVSPIGTFWNFEPTCDALNAQLVIHYICKLRVYPSSMPSASISKTLVADSSSLYDTTPRSTDYNALVSTPLLSTQPVTSSSSIELQTVSSFVKSTSLYQESSRITVTKSVPPFSISNPATADLASSPVSTTESASNSISPISTDVTTSETISLVETSTLATLVFETDTPTLATSTSTSRASQTATSSTFSYSFSKVITPSTQASTFSKELFKSSSISNGVMTSSNIRAELSSYSPLHLLSSVSSEIISQATSSPTTKLVSTLKTLSTDVTQAGSIYAKTTVFNAPTPTTASRVVTPSASPTKSTGASDKNKGKLSTTASVFIGLGAAIFVIFLIVLTVLCLKRRSSHARHQLMINEIPSSQPNAACYATPMLEMEESHDNIALELGNKNQVVYNNEVYAMNSTVS